MKTLDTPTESTDLPVLTSQYLAVNHQAIAKLGDSRIKAEFPAKVPYKSRSGMWLGLLVVLLVLAGVGLFFYGHVAGGSPATTVATPLPPQVTASVPIQCNVDTRLQFTGQFSAVDQVELRAQVGGSALSNGKEARGTGYVIMRLLLKES